MLSYLALTLAIFQPALASAVRADARTALACAGILANFKPASTASEAQTALAAFHQSVHRAWQAAGARSEKRSPYLQDRPEYGKGYWNVTWSTDWNDQITKNNDSLNTALSAWDYARGAAETSSRFDRYGRIDGTVAIAANLAARYARIVPGKSGLVVRDTVRLFSRVVSESRNPPPASTEAVSRLVSLVDRVGTAVASIKDPRDIQEIESADEQRFLDLVGSTLKAGDKSTQVYRNRIFHLDLRVTDANPLRLPTAVEIENAYLRRQGERPTYLDRKINVIELLTFDASRDRWVLHQIVRDVTIPR